MGLALLTPGTDAYSQEPPPPAAPPAAVSAHLVSMIYLLRRAAGSIDGARVGDRREDIRARWGEPPLVQGAQAMYPVGDWAVLVEVGPEQRVISLSLGRAYGNTDLQ